MIFFGGDVCSAKYLSFWPAHLFCIQISNSKNTKILVEKQLWRVVPNILECDAQQMKLDVDQADQKAFPNMQNFKTHLHYIKIGNLPIKVLLRLMS